jgi:hypothetical protein
VVIVLDAYTIDTMQRFVNKSYRFMDAYCKGLSVKAVAWCVKKQKCYRVILEGIMRAFEDYIKA